MIAQINNISVRFDQITALENISFSLNKGDFLYVLGPNGAGKSTLIKVLTRSLKPSSGTIMLTTNKLGFLPQMLNRKQNFPITVIETIYTGFDKQKLIMSKEEKLIIFKWLEKMGISHLAKNMMHTLSGGEQQRVYLIRALVSNPELLILDEPTSALDPDFRKAFHDLLNDLNAKGVTIIFVTHDLHNMDTVNKKVLHIDKNVLYFGLCSNYQKEVSHHV
ncbi:Metal ion ABC transport systems, ATPase component [Alteracholeplasma palmae J233]|uniref:Metal ion ABC transport systems, ATPase component n=1 Tax=Alteracholeplasma palmae (strain ATCC 49389 / J233) TaxID=1318466 RepID=U4KKL3_ALTPJ|nr:Metal ion ABC transport systems, ATPase component [Alteracholeplasma palmae J233]